MIRITSSRLPLGLLAVLGTALLTGCGSSPAAPTLSTASKAPQDPGQRSEALATLKAQSAATQQRQQSATSDQRAAALAILKAQSH